MNGFGSLGWNNKYNNYYKNIDEQDFLLTTIFVAMKMCRRQGARREHI
jgi:hypothetical protein